MSRSFWKTAVPSLLYLALALACLVEWRSPRAWTRIDVFSGGYLGWRLLASIHSLALNREAFRSRPVREEWWGLTSSPGWTRWVWLLMAADLAVFLDYGHWRLAPGLERAPLQAFGLALYAVAAAWQMWTDQYLATHFSGGEQRPSPIESGPFRYIRHPRYAGAIAAKIAFALVFASAIGWLLALLWTWLLARKVTAEEAHLRRLFGARYEEYARRTARLLPGIY